MEKWMSEDKQKVKLERQIVTQKEKEISYKEQIHRLEENIEKPGASWRMPSSSAQSWKPSWRK